jgi:hypothetical protein
MSVRPLLLAVVASTLVAVLAGGKVGAQTPGSGRNDCNNNGVCKVEVKLKTGATSCGVNGANVEVTPDPVNMGTDRPRRVVWHLKEPHWRFCGAAGDGIRFKNPDNDNQFSNPSTSNDDGGPPGPSTDGCHKNFRWDNANSQATAGRQYPYLIQFTFRSRPGDPAMTCVKDPFVRNGG